MLYVNKDNQTEYTDENEIQTETPSQKYNSIYDASDDISYTGLDTIRLFPEDKDMGIEVEIDGNIANGILKVIPSSLTYVSRLNNEEDGSIIVSSENGKTIKKLSITRSPKEYKKIYREIKSTVLESVFIRISSKQKVKDIQPDTKEKDKLTEYKKKLAAIQKVLESSPNHYEIEEEIIKAVSKM